MPPDPNSRSSHLHPSEDAEHRFDPTLDKLEIKRQTRQALQLILAALLTLMLGAGALFLFYDVPMPDDSAFEVTGTKLQSSPASSSTADNPLADLLSTLKSSRTEDFNLLNPKVRQFEPDTAAEGRPFLATQGAAFAAFDSLINHTKPEHWFWPDIGDGSTTEVVASAFVIQSLSNALRLRSRQELADGDSDKSIDSLIDLIRFGSALQRRPGVRIHYLVGGSAQRSGELDLELALTTGHAVPAEQLATIQELLSGLEPDRTNYQRALRTEYGNFKRSLPSLAGSVHLSSYHHTKLLEPLSPFLMKPGMTCTVRFTHEQAIHAALDEGWKEGLRQETHLNSTYEVQTRSIARRLLSPNPVGDYVHRLHTNNTYAVLENQIAKVVIHRQTILQLALRRYELAQGSLPTDLTALVPGYISEVPLDPFTDTPMRWLPATHTIYSTGADFADDGGKFNRPVHRGEPDFCMHYWWSPAAAKWREEQRLESQRKSTGGKGSKKTDTSSKPASPQAPTSP